MIAWLDPTPVDVPEDLRAAVGGHPVVAERLARASIVTPDAALRFLSPAAYVPAAPDALPDMDRAVSRLQTAVRHKQRVLVWGDFDVDGQTATALLVSALRDLGANVIYHIPNRFTEGHGIHLPTLKTLLNGGVDLLLTCDTGIAAHDAVRYAHSQMVDVVVTDHHTLAETLPPADAVVNPMRLPPGHPLRELPGVGTAYQLVRALYGSASSDHLLDLVALGIVADVMLLVDDTRYWLQRGLEVLRTAARPGIAAMLARAEINPADLTETNIGFALAPRLNALGRLADANPAVELLTTHNLGVIAERVNELEGLNQKRRFLTRQVYEAAQKQIESDDSLLKYAALVVVGAGWHTGVIGIVASRLAEEYGSPVIVLSEHAGVLSGSARSVVGCNITEAIRSQAALLNTFGGHSMAAGLSMPTENLPAFRRGISGAVRVSLGTAEVRQERQIDAYLTLPEITLDLAEDIARLAPFGNGNPPLTLATRGLHIKSRRTLGSKGDHLELRVEDAAGNQQRIVWWFGEVEALPEGKFDLAYTLRPNTFNGKREALIEWLAARPAEGGALVVSAQPRYTVLDYRTHPDPTALLPDLRTAHPDLLIWREGTSAVDGVDRYALRSAAALLVWSAPPEASVWQAALETAQPHTLILFAQPVPLPDAKTLLAQLGGLLKYALQHKQGLITVSTLAGVTGHSEATIRACLAWFNATATLTLMPLSEDVYQLTETRDQPQRTAADAIVRVTALLRETAAYRAYWTGQAL